MALYVFRQPDIGEGTTEVEIVQWHVSAGQQVLEDEPLIDVMTDKANVAITSPVTGTVLRLNGEPGQTVAVGAVLIELEVDDQDTGAGTPHPQKRVAPVTARWPTYSTSAGAPVSPMQSRRANPAPTTNVRAPIAVRASPSVRRRAFELGVSLQSVKGTAAAGRITAADLQNYIDREAAAPANTRAAHRDGVQQVKLVGLRRKIAEKMQEAKRRIPHFGYVEEFDMTQLESARSAMNAERGADAPKLTLLPFFMRGLVEAIRQFPQFNSRFDDEANILHTHEGIHIGIATQAKAGLLVPVVRHCESLDIWSSARELTRVIQAARAGSAAREELTGSTITLTSLGPLGGISATPVINHPEVAIIAPNKLREQPVLHRERLEFRTVMNVSCAFDHRVIDGYDAARFVQALRRVLENPTLLFASRA